MSSRTDSPFPYPTLFRSKTMPKLSAPNPVVLVETVVASAKVRYFFLDRMEVMLRGDGIRPDFVRASVIIDGDKGKEDDLVRLLARVKALQAFMATEDGANLLAGYKRAANILKQAGKDVAPAKAGAAGSRAPNMAAPAFAGATEMDKALLAAPDTAEPAASAAVAEERFTDAMAALASLRAPIDRKSTRLNSSH